MQNSGAIPQVKKSNLNEQAGAPIIVEITSKGFSTGALTTRKGNSVELKNSTGLDVEMVSEKSIFKVSKGKTYPLELKNSGQFKFTNKNNSQVLLIIVQ